MNKTEYETILKKYGKSSVIRVPKDVREILDISPGSRIKVTIEKE
jgi:antitoxin component of MazEF toxin-antitoxin module